MKMYLFSCVFAYLSLTYLVELCEPLRCYFWPHVIVVTRARNDAHTCRALILSGRLTETSTAPDELHQRFRSRAMSAMFKLLRLVTAVAACCAVARADR